MTKSDDDIKAEKAIAKWMLKLRESRGISQEALGSQLGKGQPYVAKIERGSQRVTLVDLLNWCAALGVPFTELGEGMQVLHEMVYNESLWRQSD